MLTTYPPLALHHPFFYNLYYALLFYFLSTPLSDFSADVDSLKPPPIYNPTDDLLNFLFFHDYLFKM